MLLIDIQLVCFLLFQWPCKKGILWPTPEIDFLQDLEDIAGMASSVQTAGLAESSQQKPRLLDSLWIIVRGFTTQIYSIYTYAV